MGYYLHTVTQQNRAKPHPKPDIGRTPTKFQLSLTQSGPTLRPSPDRAVLRGLHGGFQTLAMLFFCTHDNLIRGSCFLFAVRVICFLNHAFKDF